MVDANVCGTQGGPFQVFTMKAARCRHTLRAGTGGGFLWGARVGTACFSCLPTMPAETVSESPDGIVKDCRRCRHQPHLYQSGYPVSVSNVLLCFSCQGEDTLGR